MSAKSIKRMVVLAAVLVCVSADYLRADKLALQEKLSRDIKIKLNDVTIAEALQKISQKAGVKFVLSDEAAWKLPYGEATRLSVTLDGPLANSMTQMLNAFFMRYAVGDEVITIYPRSELEHILGTPTARQLELLRAIYTNSIAEYVKNAQNTINKGLGEYVAVVPLEAQAFLDDMLRELAGEKGELNKFELAGPMTVANMLEYIKVKTQIGQKWYTERGKWYLSETTFPDQIPEIRVVNKMDFLEAKLDQVVDISFKDERAEVILQRLASWTGMELLVQKEDPSGSWLNHETISVDLQNIKLRQALLNIVSVVDGVISIDIDDNEISIAGPIPRRKTAVSQTPEEGDRPGSESYVGKISIPMDGGKYFVEFMLRENDLTEELRKLRAEKMREILGQESKKSKKSDRR